MATQMQQTITNVRRARLGNWIAGVASAALVAGAIAVAATGLGSQQASRTHSYGVSTNVAYGIDVPTGASFAQLPQGVRDYIRVELPAFAPAEAINPRFGIDRPSGADVAELPVGLTDYLHDRSGVGSNPPSAAPSSVLGIDTPSGADVAELPNGLTDYLRPKSFNVPATNPSLGVDAPSGVDVAALPQGYRDYVRAAPSKAITTIDVTLGIDLPNGAKHSALPASITDYIR